MSRTIALALFLAVGAHAQDKPEAQPSSLVLTASLDKAKYTLPEEMQIEVRLENSGDKEVEVNELAYEESSLTFHVAAEWADKTKKDYVLSVTRPDPHVKGRLGPGRVALGPKKSMTLIRRFPTLAAGKFRITAKYASGSAEVASGAVEAEVSSPAQGNKLVATVATSQQGTFSFELNPQDAPVNVSNFVELVRRGFYNDMIWHRVVSKNWIQTGCPYGLGIGGPGYTVKAELDQASPQHDVGTVAMSNFEKTGSHGSQFFISLARLPALDKKYTIIGKVVEMEPVQAIGRSDVDKNTDRPRTDVRITNITIGLK